MNDSKTELKLGADGEGVITAGFEFIISLF